jgi:hypothetical protein
MKRVQVDVDVSQLLMALHMHCIGGESELSRAQQKHLAAFVADQIFCYGTSCLRVLADEMRNIKLESFGGTEHQKQEDEVRAKYGMLYHEAITLLADTLDDLMNRESMERDAISVLPPAKDGATKAIQ